GVEEGSFVPFDYDPMLGKLIVHGPDRAVAIARLARALGDYEITGVETTLPLFRALVGDDDFRNGAFDVQWLDRRLGEGPLAPRWLWRSRRRLRRPPTESRAPPPYGDPRPGGRACAEGSRESQDIRPARGRHSGATLGRGPRRLLDRSARRADRRGAFRAAGR